jgi:hypothetical protein
LLPRDLSTTRAPVISLPSSTCSPTSAITYTPDALIRRSKIRVQ